MKNTNSNVEKSNIFHNCAVGIGSLFLGLGGCIAAYQTDEILDKVNNLENRIVQADVNYEQSVSVLSYINTQAKRTTINESFSEYPVLSNFNSTQNELITALDSLKANEECFANFRAVAPVKDKCSTQPYLLPQQISEVAKKMENAKSIEERKNILINELQTYSPLLQNNKKED